MSKKITEEEVENLRHIFDKIMEHIQEENYALARRQYKQYMFMMDILGMRLEENNDN